MKFTIHDHIYCMFSFANIFQRKKDTIDQNANPESNNNSLTRVRNWYEERYDTIIVQRNILFVLLLLLIFLVALSVIAVTVIVNTKRFDPFVIQVDETTGMAKIVNPTSSEVLDGNEALARYLIKKYVIARETYNPVDFDTRARQVIRLCSTSSVYFSYLGYIKNKEVDPSVIYGQKNTTFLTVKSWSKLDKTKYMLRFSVTETDGSKKVFNKLAIVDFNYVALSLNDDELDINPVGFQVQGYRVDDDNS